MKKIYLAILAALLITGTQAQQTFKVKFDQRASDVKRAGNAQAHKGGSPNSPFQVTTTLVANNGYIANTTLNINFTIHSINADFEYVDSIAFTFPSTFTVNSSPNATFPTADAGGGAEALNGVTGQTISWGVNNNDKYGGIWCNPAQSFDINVSVAPGTTGNQMVHYFASGDGYGTGPGDYVDSAIIPETLPMDAKLLGINAAGISCGLSNAQVITMMVKNFGSDTMLGFMATYKINGGSAIIENPTDTILPGDTLTYNFTTTANLSAPGVYNIWAGASATGDANLANDTGSAMTENYIPTNIASTPEAMGFEPGADSLALKYWTVIDNNADGVKWATVNTYDHTGVRCIRKAASGATDDDWLMSNCLDLQSTNTYRLEYWYKVFDQVAICNLESYIGAGATVAAMTQLIVQDPVPSDTSYHQSVMLFTVPSNGTYNIGFHAYATAGTSSIRVDDINISMSPVGVQENVSKQVSVYPNPSSGLFNVNCSSANSQVEVFNLVGEKVLSKTQLNKGANALDISSMPEGSYVVRIVSGDQVSTKKIVVTK